MRDYGEELDEQCCETDSTVYEKVLDQTLDDKGLERVAQALEMKRSSIAHIRGELEDRNLLKIKSKNEEPDYRRGKSYSQDLRIEDVK